MNIEEEFIEHVGARSKSFYAKTADISVSLEMMQALLKSAEGKSARLCLHQSADDTFHQMLIVEYKGHSFPAHRHPVKSEGYHLIEGEMALQLFDDVGNLDRIFHLTKSSPIARVGPKTYHCLKVVSPYAIYHETKPGPFVRDNDKEMAPWIESREAEVNEYNRGL